MIYHVKQQIYRNGEPLQEKVLFVVLEDPHHLYDSGKQINGGNRT